jgi:GNAT superfamily N-acetyltransferase
MDRHVPEPPPGIVIRRLSPAETDLVRRVGDLVADVYGSEGHVTGGYLDVLRRAEDRVARAEVLVALDDVDGELLATVTFAPGPGPYSDIAAPGDAEFRMLAVAPAARRRGLGRALVEACIGRARTGGARRLRLSTGPTMTDAHRLYESLGFVRTPELDWQPSPEDPVLETYCLDLEPGGGSGDQAQPA